MVPNGLGDTHERGLSIAGQVPAYKHLFAHWTTKRKELEGLAQKLQVNGPPNRKLESIPEWMGKAQRFIDESNRLSLEIAQIESYLGRNPNSVDPQIVENANWMAAARWVRAMIQNGESDKEVATFLRNSFEQHRTYKKLGRPLGAMNCDRQALTALVIHDSNPRFWTWAKLADNLLDCKVHKAHEWDSECTAKLKKSVSRLRAFLRDLDAEFTVK